MEQFEYLVIDNGFMATNRRGLGSMTDEAGLSAKLTREYGEKGWKLVAVLGDDFIFIRPLPEYTQAQVEAVKKVLKPGKKKEAT